MAHDDPAEELLTGDPPQFGVRHEIWRPGCLLKTLGSDGSDEPGEPCVARHCGGMVPDKAINHAVAISRTSAFGLELPERGGEGPSEPHIRNDQVRHVVTFPVTAEPGSLGPGHNLRAVSLRSVNVRQCHASAGLPRAVRRSFGTAVRVAARCPWGGADEDGCRVGRPKAEGPHGIVEPEPAHGRIAVCRGTDLHEDQAQVSGFAARRNGGPGDRRRVVPAGPGVPYRTEDEITGRVVVGRVPRTRTTVAGVARSGVTEISVAVVGQLLLSVRVV